MNSDLVSRVYKPDAAQCCEACVFERGKHAEWCERGEGERLIEKQTAKFDAIQRARMRKVRQ